MDEFNDYDEDLFGPEIVEDWGPVDAIVRLSPSRGNSLAWVERYGRLVVTRHTTASADPADPAVTFETMYPTEAKAMQEFARRCGALVGDGYVPVED